MNKKHHPMGSNSVLCVVIAIIAIFTCLGEVRQQRTDQGPFGRLTQLEIASRLSELTRISLLPGDATVSISRIVGISSHGDNRRYWEADYTDSTGERTGEFQWDADTGELMTLSRRSPPPLLSAPDLTRAEAIAHAWRLLKQPILSVPDTHWRLSDARLVNGVAWRIYARSPTRLVYMNIDKHTDQVLFLRILPRIENSSKP